MPLKVLVVAATPAEADCLTIMPGMDLISIVTGIGSVATAWGMTKHLSSGMAIDLAINIGIAGSYCDEIQTGDVVLPVSDCFADAGIETKSGYLTLAEAGLQDPDAFPFTSGRIVSENRFISHAAGVLRTVNAVTVNTATGSENSIKRIIRKYNPDIETMEGAAFSYNCSCERVDYLALRSVSNIIGLRLKQKWDIPLALTTLTRALDEFLTAIDF